MGRSIVEKRGWGVQLKKSRYGKWLLEEDTSQTRLMAAVLFCRLLPGLNLDGLSYVAGATPISLWRFCLATLGGLLPYSLLLVAAGRGLVEMGFTSGAHLLTAVIVVIIVLGIAGTSMRGMRP
jgi:uncharacterized membrane protein YdjX (TVP38/TMEM64 family)